MAATTFSRSRLAFDELVPFGERVAEANSATYFVLDCRYFHLLIDYNVRRYLVHTLLVPVDR